MSIDPKDIDRMRASIFVLSTLFQNLFVQILMQNADNKRFLDNLYANCEILIGKNVPIQDQALAKEALDEHFSVLRSNLKKVRDNT